MTKKKQEGRTCTCEGCGGEYFTGAAYTNERLCEECATKEPHTITVFNPAGDFICDIPFNNDEWKQIEQAAIQMFVVKAIKDLVKKEAKKFKDV